MTSLRLSGDLPGIAAADILIVPVFSAASGAGGVELALDAELATLESLVPAIKGVPAALRHAPRFTGALGQVAPVLTGGAGGPAVLAVGVGPRAGLTVDAVRTAAQAAAAATLGAGNIVIALGLAGRDPAGAVRACVEGVTLGRHLPPGAPPQPIERDDIAVLVSPDTAEHAAVRRAFEAADVTAGWANWVRRLVDLPPSDLQPATFAALVAGEAARLGVAAEIWDREAMLAHGFGGTAAVGAGSAASPRVVVLRTAPRPDRPPLGLAGKGMTFDSGGLNLKRNLAEIFRMKDDMAGAAAIAGAIFAAVELGAAPDIVAVLPMAENMPSGTAQRPGDILVHPGGLRTEVVDTDCEGRLILADAIAFLASLGVAGIVDVGTLTDGGGVGPLLWGCWANDDALAAAVLAAGAAAGEPGWRLPLRPEYRQLLASRVADIANAPLTAPDIGLTAATFLRAFVGETPWVHIDNGSSAFLEEEIAAWPAGPTGSPMRAVLQLLLDRG